MEIISLWFFFTSNTATLVTPSCSDGKNNKNEEIQYDRYNILKIYIGNYLFWKRPQKEYFLKHSEKRRKCWWAAFSPLLTMFYFFFNPFPKKPRACSTCLLKTLCEKEKLLLTSNFFFSHCVFYPIRELSAIFIKLKIVVCKLFQFGAV